MFNQLNWNKTENLGSHKYQCGYCGEKISSQLGYWARPKDHSGITTPGYIFICHECNAPTAFDYEGNQYPGPLIGNKVNHIPNSDVANLFDEARRCFSIQAYTSTVSCCRKLLMNISVDQGAKEGLGYTDYVDFLEKNNFIPPNGKQWVEEIKKHGNKANHKIVPKTAKEAERILTFTEMLLRFVYEMAGMMK